MSNGSEHIPEQTTDYKALIEDARSGFLPGDESSIEFRLMRAVEELLAERDALQAVIEKVRSLIRERTFAETLATDFDGNLWPQMVNMDDLRDILSAVPSDVLAEVKREAAAQERRDWADWADSASAHVPGITVEQVVTALRSDRRPFGVSAGIREGDNR